MSGIAFLKPKIEMLIEQASGKYPMRSCLEITPDLMVSVIRLSKDNHYYWGLIFHESDFRWTFNVKAVDDDNLTIPNSQAVSIHCGKARAAEQFLSLIEKKLDDFYKRRD